MKSGYLYLLKILKHSRRSDLRLGFTIVELLVVIVVIGLIATITIVSYTGIQQKATVASLVSNLDSASKILKMDQAVSGSYPTALAEANGGNGIPINTNTTYQYIVNNIPGSPAFCVTATKDAISYKITNDKVPSLGTCLDFGLILHLDASDTASYPGSGTAWTDLSGNSSNGTLAGGALYSIDGGGSMYFNGAGAYVDIPYASQYNIRNAITISVWIKRTTGFEQTRDTMILGRAPSWYFYDSYNSGQIRGEVFTNGARNGGIIASVPFDGFWYQITYTYDSETHIEKMYKNGVMVSSHTLPIMSNYLIDSSISNFAPMGLNTVGRGMFLNDASVYNRAITADEASLIFNNDKGRYGL